MRRQIRSEFRKLTTTRSVYWLAAGVAALCFMAAASVSNQGEDQFLRPLAEQQFVLLGTFSKLLLIVLGIKAVTDEYRFGTVLPTFVAQPVRARVIAAKVVVIAIAGVLIGMIGQIVLMGTAAETFALNGHPLDLDGAVRIVGGNVVAGGLWAVLGVGIGALIRSQVVAIVGSFVWLMGIEEIVRPKLGDLAVFLPGQAGFALAIAEKAFLVGLAGMAGWALVALLAGTLVTERADVT